MPALFIVLEKPIPGFDSSVNGTALSASEERLDRLAKKLKVTSLMDFFSISPQEAMDFLEGEAEATGTPLSDIPRLEEEKWFSATEGLTVVRALHQELVRNPKYAPKSKAIINDLNEFEKVLKRAAAEDVRWHLAVDF